MVMATVPVMTRAEIQPSVPFHALLFLDLCSSLHTQDRVPKLRQQDKLGGWSHMHV